MPSASDLIKELSGLCCRCGNDKEPHETFCHACYSSLPKAMQSALYRRVGNGYEEAYEAAVDHLDK